MDVAGAPPRRHVVLVRVLLGLATVLAVLSILAVWANRQVFNADNWSSTSGQVLEDPAVQSELSSYLVDQLYTNVDVAGELRSQLPPTLQGLAGPVAGGLREVARRTTLAMLDRPRVQQAWEEANRLTAQQFINIAEGKSKAVTANGDAVVLDLRVLLVDLARRVGLSGRLVGQLPPTAARVKILDGGQVKTLQNGTKLLKGLAFVLPVLSLALLALSVYLAQGRRRRTLLWAGLDLCLAGFIVLIVRRVAGTSVIDSLVGQSTSRPAALSTWSIATGLLQDVAQATIIAGIPVVLAALLAGPSRIATEIRRRLAPALREHPGGAYAVLAAVLVLVVIWGPIPATQKVVPVLVMCALAAFGLKVLRDQTLEEFPAPAAAGAASPPAQGNGSALEQDTTVMRPG